ncbi:MAG: transaldolase family protein [Candidatus Krumholzibacteriia bacterium]
MPLQPLRLFLDSADVDQWDRWLPLGVFHGVTTNPLLLDRAGQACTYDNLARLGGRAFDLGAREIHLQAWGDDPDELVACGRRLATLAPQVAVKVPATDTGLRAARRLLAEDLVVTVTAVYNAGQVLAAAAVGARYAAPYLGRLDDLGRDGTPEVIAMHELLQGTDNPTRLLVASLRSWDKVVELAWEGLDTFTFGPAVAAAMLDDEDTAAAAAEFLAAARRREAD